jgi:ATP-binding cassette subfamily F protein 3
MLKLMPEATEAQRRTRLGTYGFGADKADTKCAKLSGGEKARLLLALAAFHGPHLLILDEPTNHLDVDSREALVHALTEYEGAVILISHDRHLIELTADRLWLVADGRVRPFEGDVDRYRQGLLGRARGNGADDGRRSERQRGAEQRQRLAPLRQAAKQAERELERLSRDRSALAARLASAATYRLPGAEVEALARRDAELEAAIAVAETRWLEAEQELEQAQA